MVYLHDGREDFPLLTIHPPETRNTGVVHSDCNVIACGWMIVEAPAGAPLSRLVRHCCQDRGQVPCPIRLWLLG